MSLDAVIKKIDRHLKKDFAQPLIVDVQNPDDFQAIWQHYNVGSYIFLKAQDYCGKDSIPQFDRLYSDLAQNEGIVFVTGISIFLKLQGEQFLKESLRTLLSLSTKGHIVVITYQCRKYLTFSDPRLQNRIVIVESKEAHQPSLIFASDNFKTKTSNTVVNGLDSLSVVENTDVEQISVYTKKTRTSFPLSLIYITDLNKAYDVLCSIDKTTAQLTDTLGTDAQWAYALELFENKSSWGELIESLFGNRNALQHIIQNFMSFSDNQKWLYFVALKLYGCPENWCLDTASKTATGSTDIVRHIYRGILSVEPKSKDFSKIYNQRKQLLNQLGNPLDEVVDFCKVVISKGENAMPEKGEHSGRCCLKSEIDETPAYATDAGDFWALANYDRFKGSRKANVEVHGGATLEEITVPIIEISYNPGKVEVHILPIAENYVDFNATPEIEVSFRKKAAVRIYISANVSDVNLRIDGKIYEAQATEPNYFYVEMPDIKRPKTYYADVFAGDNPLAENLPIKIKSEGMGSNKKSIL